MKVRTAVLRFQPQGHLTSSHSPDALAQPGLNPTKGLHNLAVHTDPLPGCNTVALGK